MAPTQPARRRFRRSSDPYPCTGFAASTFRAARRTTFEDDAVAFSLKTISNRRECRIPMADSTERALKSPGGDHPPVEQPQLDPVRHHELPPQPPRNEVAHHAVLDDHPLRTQPDGGAPPDHPGQVEDHAPDHGPDKSRRGMPLGRRDERADQRHNAVAGSKFEPATALFTPTTAESPRECRINPP